MFPIIPANTAAASFPKNDEGIFGYGNVGAGGNVSTTNLVSNAGVVASDVTGVGTIRHAPAATEYGDDKGIFAYGHVGSHPVWSVSMSNLVSNAGVVSSDVTGVGTERRYMGACGYGGDKGIFAYGSTIYEYPHNTPHGGYVSMSNLVSNAGVVASDVTGVGTARMSVAACEYGDDKALFAFGQSSSKVSTRNLVSNAGVISSDATGAGSVRANLAACEYGEDKGIFGYGYGAVWAAEGPSAGYTVSMSNLVSNTGVVASDVAGVGTPRYSIAGCEYGQDKGIFGFGYGTGYYAITNLVSNAGVVASDQAATTGSARDRTGACSFN